MIHSKYHSLKPFILPSTKNFKIDWPEEFGRQAPLVVEIGFGSGDFLIRKARENPEENFIGIEHHWMPVWQTLRKIATIDVRNIRLVFSDARVAFERLFEEKSLKNIFALFPDPWFKRRHEKHRLFSSSFLRLVNNRLEAKGIIEIVTDNFAYFDWVQNEARGANFSVGAETIHPRFDTRYERKWSRKGQREFYKLTLTKNRHAKISIKKEAALKTFRFKDFYPERFRPEGQSGEVAIAFKEFLFDPKLSKGMLHTVACEENLTQQFWISIFKEAQNWRLGVHDGCPVIPTASASQALELAYQAALKTAKS